MLNELKSKLSDLVKQMRALHEKIVKENRDFSDAEKTEWEKLESQANKLKEDIEKEERMNILDGMTRTDQNGRGAHLLDPSIGMTPDEVRNYSLVRAINAAANNNWSQAGLELEASRAVAKKFGAEPRGFFIPYDWMIAEKRDLEKGTSTKGPELIATDLLSQNFIELLRNKMVLKNAGAITLAGLVGDIAIPKLAGGATAYWVAEGNPPTESDLTLGQVPFDPKDVAAFSDISRKLLKQSSIDVEMLVRNDFASVLALAIDYAGLHAASGGNDPTGIAAISGVAVVAIGADGGAPTWAHIVELETEVSVDNADIGRLAYVTNAKVRGKLKQTEKATNTAKFVWEDPPNPLNGYPALVSNQVRSDLTKGTGTNLSAIFFGNWGDAIIAMWGTLDVLVDPYTGGTSGTVRVIAFQSVDFNVRHPESFSVVLDADTA